MHTNKVEVFEKVSTSGLNAWLRDTPIKRIISIQATPESGTKTLRNVVVAYEEPWPPYPPEEKKSVPYCPNCEICKDCPIRQKACREGCYL